MANLKITGAEKYYDNFHALKDVSIDVKDGEFLVLVGPSGCGKSTLLRMIAGLEGFSGGTLHIGDRDVTDEAPKKRDIAMVFQNYALYPHMKVGRNMGFPLEISKVDKAVREKKVADAAEILGLGKLLDRYPRQLSGGQRQRVAMGRAIVRDPAVFLFDEPLSNLDAQLRVEMRAEIKSLHQRLGATIVYVTHDQVEAMTMADRIAVMRGGVVEQLGTPMELYDSPANTFVAGFIGSPPMNLVPGKVSAEGAGYVFRADGGGEITLHSVPAAAATGAPVLLGARPETMQIGETGLDAKVTLVEPMGSETLVLCDHGGTKVQVLLRDRRTIRAGDTLKIAPEAQAPVFFDADTGGALT